MKLVLNFLIVLNVIFITKFLTVYSINAWIFRADSTKREVYYMGLIDILTHYDTKKKAAHAMKTAKHGVICNIKLYTSCLIYGIKLFFFNIWLIVGSWKNSFE